MKTSKRGNFFVFTIWVFMLFRWKLSFWTWEIEFVGGAGVYKVVEHGAGPSSWILELMLRTYGFKRLKNTLKFLSFWISLQTKNLLCCQSKSESFNFSAKIRKLDSIDQSIRPTVISHFSHAFEKQYLNKNEISYA